MRDLTTSKIAGAEALLRWRHPEHGLLEPNRFLPGASDRRLLGDIGTWVARAVCTQASDWLRRGVDVSTSFNLSGAELRDPKWIDAFLEVVTGLALPPHRVAIEIPETALIRQRSRLDSALRRLREHGIDVYVEGVGRTGSTFGYLERVPIDRIKVDPRPTDRGPDVSEELDTAIRAARSRGVLVCGERIETRDRLDLVRRIGGRYGQGFLLGGPVPVGRFESEVLRDAPQV